MLRTNVKKGFTLTELLVAIGLLVGVLAASTMIFHYSIEAQRTAMATAEIMRTLRAITDQLNLNLTGLRTDGYLILYSDEKSTTDTNDHCDALYFFSNGDFQSVDKDDVRSNIARIYFGHANKNINSKEPNNLLLDIKLLTPGQTCSDCGSVSFAECQQYISHLEYPNDKLDNSTTGSRPPFDANNPDNLLSQRIGNMLIQWTYNSDQWGTVGAQKIKWYGQSDPKGEAFEQAGFPYRAVWTPYNQDEWPKALRFVFTIYDSKGIFKNGRTFEHIVYIGR